MNRSRPRDHSQAGRILRLLESANGGKVSLLDILSLRISQYSARIFDLRHRFGFKIENGSEPGRPEHTWFRLVGREVPSPGTPSRGLFPADELKRTAKWEDVG